MSDAVKTTQEAEKSIVIDGKAYSVEGMSAEARAQIGNLQATDAELRRLAIKTAIVQTARSAYAKALKDELTKAGTQPSNGSATN